MVRLLGSSPFRAWSGGLRRRPAAGMGGHSGTAVAVLRTTSVPTLEAIGGAASRMAVARVLAVAAVGPIAGATAMAIPGATLVTTIRRYRGERDRPAGAAAGTTAAATAAAVERSTAAVAGECVRIGGRVQPRLRAR